MTTAVPTRSGQSHYRVQPHECLSKIAERVYGRTSLWPELARINGIRQPYYIQVGQRLRTPTLSLATQSHQSSHSIRTASSPTSSPSPTPSPISFPTSTSLSTRNRSPTPTSSPWMLPQPPTSILPCPVELKLDSDTLKKIFPQYESTTKTIGAACLKFTIELLDIEMTVARKACGPMNTTITPHSGSIDVDSKNKMIEGIYKIASSSAEYDVIKKEISLKVSHGIEFSDGLGNDWKFKLDSSVTSAEGVVKLGMKFSRTTTRKFIYDNFEYNLKLTVSLKIEPSKEHCPIESNIAALVPKKIISNESVFSQIMNSPNLKVIVLGTGIVVLGVLIAANTILLAPAAALILLTYGVLATDESNRYLHSQHGGIL